MIMFQNVTEISLPVLLILAFGVMRWSSLLAYEGGPHDLFSKLRHEVGVLYDEHSNPYGTTMLSRGILCTRCNSIWVGVIVAVLYAIYPPLITLVMLPFALSGMAILLMRDYE